MRRSRTPAICPTTTIAIVAGSRKSPEVVTDAPNP
jgi:hypothetical protein